MLGHIEYTALLIELKEQRKEQMLTHKQLILIGECLSRIEKLIEVKE
tara:strand:+ start:44 stop:184 length:141 start_codon:yes stop_codon:yes gene_type:complete